MNTPRRLLLVMVLIVSAGFSYASDIYIAQNAAGGNTGADCADAHSATWFNTSANWGSGSGKIGPGTTVHLCGTFNVPAGATELTFQGAGSTGNPITLLFESGANFTSPYFGQQGAITSNGNSNLVINGQNSLGSNTGVIQNTANGTQLANQQSSEGVSLYSCNNCTVENLTINNIYVHTCTLPVSNCTDENGQNTGLVYINDGSNVTISNVTGHDAKWCIEYSFNTAGNANVSLTGNTVYNCDHGLTVGDGDPGNTLANLLIYNNTVHDLGNWDDATDQNHHDGIHAWCYQSGGNLSGTVIYNNYIYGTFGVNFNSAIYLEGTQASPAPAIFNNVIAETGNTSHAGSGYIAPGQPNFLMDNNTIVGPNTSWGCGLCMNQGTSYNNIVSTMLEAMTHPDGAPVAIDYQDYYNIGSGGWGGGGPLSAWVSWCQANYPGTIGCDVHSISGNPNLNSSYEPNTGSPVIQAGTNLYSLCNGQPNPGLGALCYDKAGTARPTTGAWDIGAYQYGSGDPPPSPPSGLQAIVQ